MSRLYMKCDSDSRKTQLTTRGHKEIRTRVYYGSRYDSKLAVDILVQFEAKAELPTVSIEFPKSIMDNIITRHKAIQSSIA